ncbi:MAG: hypothetical protein NVSMB62_22660 [Acidobacteriaceae bacterium]
MVAASVAVLIVVEEFYWLALTVLRVRDTTFVVRISVQSVSLCVTGLAVHLSGVQPLIRGSGATSQFSGYQMDSGFLEKMLVALLHSDWKSLADLWTAQHAVVVGAMYAIVVFVSSSLFIRRLAGGRSWIASFMVSIMVVGTLYMAIRPLKITNAATPRLTTPEQRDER